MAIIDEYKIILNNIDKNNKPNLFLHSCCAPCSTEVLNKLKDFFNIYIIFYNPNIDTIDEYNLRLDQFDKIKNNIGFDNIKIIYTNYNHNEFIEKIKGLENEKEGGKRCTECFKLRLNFTYEFALKYIKENNMENDINYITTTLTISPHKDAIKINNILKDIIKDKSINYLPSDFKKENGYLNSINYSKEYNLYRQHYCGCEFSKTT